MPNARELRQATAKAEEERLLKEKMDAAGLSYVEQDLPDDELDTSKGMMYTLRAMWPGTDEYYEAQQAEMEMDDLTKLKIERVKADDLVALAKSDYDEALEQLLAASGNDFFFFNKLKFAMEAEGKWAFEPPKQGLFAGGDEAERRRNRLRRAFRAPLPLPQDLAASASASAGAGGASSSGAGAGGDEASALPKQCPWRGKNKAGDFLQCNNARLPHATATALDKSTSKMVPVQLPFCSYHMKECIGAQHDAAAVPIRTPNALALCTECHASAKPGVRMVPMTLDACPGVSAVSLQAPVFGAGAGAGAAGGVGVGVGGVAGAEEEEKVRTAESVCEWRPGKRELKLRGWVCTNRVLQHPETKVFLATCGMHVKVRAGG